MEEIERKTACCFTGHRPEKLRRTESEVISTLKEAIDEAVSDGYRTFISGMSRGVDIWAAEEIIRRKKDGEDLKLICAPAFVGAENSWGKEWKSRYTQVISQADGFYCVEEKYTGLHIYQKRDEWMVDNSGLVLAVYDGERGGTRNTIEYALKNGVKVELL